jgi:colanic acid biosynthesis glycosyl transferase WcaI
MKILFMIGSFPPEISTSRLGFQLCKSFQKSNNKVVVLTSFPRQYLVKAKVSGHRNLLYREKVDGLDVIRVGPEFSRRDDINMRGFEYFYQFFSFVFAGLTAGETDIIMCCSPPLTIVLAGYFLGKIKQAPVLVRVGDLHPQELIDLGMIKNKILIRVLSVMEKLVYRKSSFLTVLSEGYRQHILIKGAEESKTLVLPNWGDIEELDKLGKTVAVSIFERKKFIVTYAGIISWFQDLETLIDAANILKSNTDIGFLIVGDGTNKRNLEKKCASLKLSNVTFMPLQQRDEYLRILQNSNVCIVAIKKELTTTTIPSKIFDIMTCERPLLAIVPKGEVTELISQSNCGYWIKPEDSQMVADKILMLYKNPNLTKTLGQNGRRFLESHFTLSVISKKHEVIMEKLVKSKDASIKKRISEFLAI